MSNYSAVNPVVYTLNGHTSPLNTYLKAFVHHWKTLLCVPAIFALVAALVSLIIPDIYKAHTKIMIRQMNQSNAAAMLSQANSLAGSAGSGFNIRIPIDPNVKLSSDLYVALLKSKSTADALIEKFSLEKYYGVTSTERARVVLSKKTTIRTTKEGLIDIFVEDNSSKHAALLANAYVNELQKLLQKLELTDASQRRLFFEQKMQTAKEKTSQLLADVRNATAKEAEPITPKEQEKAREVAGLRANLAFKEIQLGAAEIFSGGSNSENDHTRQELNKLRADLSQLGTDNQAIKSNEDPKSLHNEGNKASLKLLQDIQYYEILSKLLEKEYQIALLDENKEVASSLKVIDQATSSEFAEYPNRPVVTVLAGVTGLFLVILYILYLVSFGSQRTEITR